MKHKNFGFTLIELLIALGLFSIVALSLYSTFAAGIKLHRRAADVTGIQRDALWILNWMTRDLENAVGYNFDASYPSQVAFQGESSKITFLVATSNGLKTVSYSIQSNQTTRIHKVLVGKHVSRLKSVLSSYEEQGQLFSLVREERDFVDSLQPSLPGNEDILTSVVKPDGLKFSFLYFEGSGQSQKMSWTQEWKENVPPLGVEVSISLVNLNKSKEVYMILKKILIPSGSGVRLRL